MCDWYALCDNAPDGTVAHPVLGSVRTCVRCATKHGLAFERTLYDADTAEPIGPATPEQVTLSDAAADHDGGAGIFIEDGRRYFTL